MPAPYMYAVARIAVIRMEMHNHLGSLIAVATAPISLGSAIGRCVSRV